MKQTISILSLCAAALLAGCKSENSTQQVEDAVVTFVARPVTKVAQGAAGPQFERGDEIAVFAPLANTGFGGTSSIDGQYGQHTTKGEPKDCRYIADNNNNFAPYQDEDKIRYGATTTSLDFYAVWPSKGPGSAGTTTVDKNDYTIDLGDIGDQGTVGNVLPYMYSNNAKGRGMQSGSVVNLEFRYVLSKITVAVNYDPLMTGGALTNVEFYADGGLYRECLIDLKQEAYTQVAYNGGRNVLADATNPYRFWVAPQVPGNDGVIMTSTWGYVVPNAGGMRVAKPVIILTFGEGTATSTKYVCPIPNTDNIVTGGIVAGKEYRYIVDIVPDAPVSVGGVMDDWEVVGNEFPTFWAQ